MTRLKSRFSGLHDWSARFGGMLILSLSLRSHSDVYDVINMYNDCVILYMCRSGAVVQSTHVN